MEWYSWWIWNWCWRMSLVWSCWNFWHRMLLLVQTPGFRKRHFTCKPGSIHVLSCGIAKILLLCGGGCCILYRIAILFIWRSVTRMTNWFVLRIICLYLLSRGSPVAEQLILPYVPCLTEIPAVHRVLCLSY